MSKIGYNIEEAAARQRVFYYQVKIFWYFFQIDTRWIFCSSIYYQVKILWYFFKLIPGEYFFFQITTRWKYFSISFKIDTRWICFLQIITKWKYFYIFWNWKLIDWKQKLSNVQRIRCLKKKNEKDILGLLSFQNMSTRKGEREILQKLCRQKESKVMILKIWG